MREPGHEAAGGPVTPSAERRAEVAEVIRRVTDSVRVRDDVVGLLLVGSWARDAARPDSDVDLVLLAADPARYPLDAWLAQLRLGTLVRARSWGAIAEWRFRTPTGLEVEINIGSPDWAETSPVDAGTRRVVIDGARPLHDPAGVLARLVDACRSEPA